MPPSPFRQAAFPKCSQRNICLRMNDPLRARGKTDPDGSAEPSSHRNLPRVSPGHPSKQLLERQAFAADAAAVRKDLAPVLGGHAGTKPDAALAGKCVRLECTFHTLIPSIIGGSMLPLLDTMLQHSFA